MSQTHQSDSHKSEPAFSMKRGTDKFLIIFCSFPLDRKVLHSGPWRQLRLLWRIFGGKDESSRLTYLRLLSLRDSFGRKFIGRVIKDLTEGRPSLPVSNLAYAIARLHVLVNFKGLWSLHGLLP